MSSEEREQICRLVVHQARRLRDKGADGSCSSPFVKMTSGRERFITSVADKSPNPKWNEDCEFNITKGNPSVELLVCHRGKLLDDFLGMVTIHPMSEQGKQSISRKWYKLQHRPNKTKKDVKDRGEIDVSVEVLDNNLEYLCLDDVSEVIGHSVRAKRSSTLPVMSPGMRSKLTMSRIKNYIAPHRDGGPPSDFMVPERVKSISNDSGKASDSFTSDSPTSVRRTASFNASENFGSEESIESTGKSRKKGLRKKMKNAFGSLKREKTPHKDTSDSPYSSASSLPTEDPQQQLPCTDPSAQRSPCDEPSRPPPQLPQDVPRRNRIASTSDLHATPVAREPRPLSYPLRSISEDHIPLQVMFSQTDPQRAGHHGGGGSQQGADSGQSSTEDIKMRHSFRSGLPSLRKSNVCVTFDPSAVGGYGTREDAGEQQKPLPSQYMNMTKEALIRRLLLKEQLLRDRQRYVRELEDYTDNLLLKVILESPRLLERDFHPIKKS
ncbi:rab11 family-interacting protein 2-like isoform X2 [Asterias rubens]|uniref:rab11 family-interacting protein 2-like isoform X2 n=1 Tax=Asterias rubens TaxID=7604 RepID=UPI001454EB79|nr:rab11 family-interacting protein 2-like isoform X2 [Asterias rubens]